MFDSFRNKLKSVVQDGIHINKTVKEKISQAQQHSAKSLYQEDRINPIAGSSILEKYQNDWKDIHEMAEKCSQEAELVDSYMTDIHLGVVKRLQDISQINSSLVNLPKVIAEVESSVGRLRILNGKFNEVESALVNLEMVIDRCDFEQRKVEHIFQLSMYKEKKLAALENSRVNLAAKQTQVLREADMRHRNMLKERQMVASQAFQEDLNLYKAQGELPRKISLSKEKETELTLEEIQLTEEDTAELDKFLEEK